MCARDQQRLGEDQGGFLTHYGVGDMEAQAKCLATKSWFEGELTIRSLLGGQEAVDKSSLVRKRVGLFCKDTKKSARYHRC